MGLNFVPRPPREQLDPPNDFVSASLGAVDFKWKHELMADAVLEFEDAVLDRVLERVRRIGFAVRDPA